MATGKRSTLWVRYVDTVGVVDKSVNYALGEWGAFVAHRPVITMAVSFIVALGLMAGLALIADNVESASDRLWCVSELHCRLVSDELATTVVMSDMDVLHSNVAWGSIIFYAHIENVL